MRTERQSAKKARFKSRNISSRQQYSTTRNPGSKGKGDVNWMLKFEELKAYEATHGHIKVPRKHDKTLQQWMWRQRYHWRKNELPEEKRNLLDSLGFFNQGDLTTPNRARNKETAPDYAKWILQLKDYRAKHGDFHVVPVRDKSLYNWVWRQKRLIKQNELPQKRRDLLASIGFFEQNESVATAPSHQRILIDLTSSRRNAKVTLQQPSPRTSLIDRTLFLEKAVGIAPDPNDNLCSKVTFMEVEVFGNVKKGTIVERIHALEKELK